MLDAGDEKQRLPATHTHIEAIVFHDEWVRHLDDMIREEDDEFWNDFYQTNNILHLNAAIAHRKAVRHPENSAAAYAASAGIMEWLDKVANDEE